VSSVKLRTLPADFDPLVVSQIDARLDSVRATPVTLCHVVESGSRAWGFPSPDSDYDCRFIYVRPVADYLTPWGRRDVIETPLDAVLDVNGWDLAKALRLMLKGNAVVLEWLTSPVIYETLPGFRDDLLSLAEQTANQLGLARHYFHLGTRQWQHTLSEGSEAKLKKLFYALRPAMALRWLARHPTQAVPPMHFPTLMAESDVPADVAALCSTLITQKAVTRELGTGPVPALIGAFIEAEFAAAGPLIKTWQPGVDEALRRDAEALFRKYVQACDQT
jgi:uncharacterized protein